MKKISGATFFTKNLFPAIWLGLFSISSVSMVLTKPILQPAMPIVLMVVILVLGFFVFKKTAWILLDEAHDNGDELVFRNGGKEQTVKLADIMNVSVSTHFMDRVERVTVTVRAADAIGDELVFVARGRFLRFDTHPMVRDLILRIDQARRAA